MSNVHVMDHPLIQHKIGIIRREETGSKDFRMMIGEIAMLMCYEATRDLKLQDVEIHNSLRYHHSAFGSSHTKKGLKLSPSNYRG